MSTVQQLAEAAEGNYVVLPLDVWRDQLDQAVEPASHVGRRILADCRLGAAGATSPNVGVKKSDALAVCAMEPGSTLEVPADPPEPVAPEPV